MDFRAIALVSPREFAQKRFIKAKDEAPAIASSSKRFAEVIARVTFNSDCNPFLNFVSLRSSTLNGSLLRFAWSPR